MGIPAHVSDQIADHLDAIARLFKNPKVTLIVRTPDLPTGDVIMTQDTADELRAVLDRTFKPERAS